MNLKTIVLMHPDAVQKWDQKTAHEVFNFVDDLMDEAISEKKELLVVSSFVDVISGRISYKCGNETTSNWLQTDVLEALSAKGLDS